MTTRGQLSKYNEEADRFIKELNEWLTAINTTNDFAHSSDYYDVKHRASYYDSVDFNTTPLNDGVIYSFSVAGIKIIISNTNINVFKKSVILNTYIGYSDINLTGELKVNYTLIKELTVDLYNRKIGDKKTTYSLIPPYLDSIIDYLSLANE
jgi:hypothetical protein